MKYFISGKNNRLTEQELIQLHLRVESAIQESNELIKSMSVWGRSGSKWRLNPKGDYDFTTIWMVRLLYEFGHEDEILFPETRDYLVNTLLDSGGKPDLYVPLSLGMVFDTENHLLMREGTRYLKNQWKKTHGSEAARYDNHRNGMERWMVRYLNAIRVNGLYEYNSMPYTTYTVLPLLNLADYAQSPEVRILAVSILDNIILRYAYGSLEWKQCTSFRRQTRYANSNRLDLNPIDLPLQLWAGLEYSHSQLQDERGPMLLAAVFSGYTPAQESMDILLHKPNEYYAIFEHLQRGAPELYSGSAHYLLSAGGAYQRFSGVISRPITLLLPGQGDCLTDTIRIEGIGDWRTWNMTGIHQRFAVAKGNVIIPEQFNVSLSFNQWTVFNATEHITAAVYQADEFGLMALFSEIACLDKLKQSLNETNPISPKKKAFVWPENMGPLGIEIIKFNTDASNRNPVIVSVNNGPVRQLMTRYWQQWPLAYLRFAE